MSRGQRSTEAEQLLDLLARHSPDVIWMFDPDWSELKFVGEAYETVWGRPIDALVENPRDFLNGIHPDDRERVRAGMTRLSNEKSVEGEYRVNEEEDFARTVWSKGEPVYDEDGAFVAVAGFVRDIPSREQDRVELERKTERLTEFANVIAHNLKNPLNVATGHLAMLEDACPNQHRDAVSDALDRMDAIIEETLTLAQQGRSVDTVSQFAVSDVLTESWDMVETADASLEIEDTFEIQGDPDRLRTLFENVFRNAITHGGTDVTVRIGLIDGCGFYVEDTGQGIPPADRDAVFEPGHTTSQSGTGLGLTIVRRIAEAHGWTVRMVEGTDGGARIECTNVNLRP